MNNIFRLSSASGDSCWTMISQAGKGPVNLSALWSYKPCTWKSLSPRENRKAINNKCLFFEVYYFVANS